MVFILSPSKSMEFDLKDIPAGSKPTFQKEAVTLAEIISKKSKTQLKKLLNISDRLASLNFDRYQEFSPTVNKKIAKPAIFAYTGDVYQGIEPEAYSKKDLDFASKHMRIISGLYGCLKPLDLIQPYRLEMSTKLKNPAGANLYDFWSEVVTLDLNKALKASKSQYLLNLASNEYSKVINEQELVTPIINVTFKEYKAGKYKVIAIFAKKARGLMAEYIVKNKALSVKELSKFNKEGYAYNSNLSSDFELVFTRD